MTEIKMTARPWMPQDLLDDLQSIIDEESDDYLNTRRTTLEMALAYLKEHFAEQTWIPVSKRLPDDRGRYIVAANDGHAIRVSFADWQNRSFQWYLTGARSYWKVTHWMPLPEPPEG